MRGAFAVLLISALMIFRPFAAFGSAPDLESGWIPAEWPDWCHSLGRAEAVSHPDKKVESWKPATYTQMMRVVKHDVVCIGNEVVIDTPIFSNGGDVFIYGSSVTIQAPIDTRIYRAYAYEEHFMNPNAAAGFPPGAIGAFSPDYQNVQVLLDGGQQSFTVAIARAFRDYYKCEECRVVRDKRPATARLPDGFTFPMANTPPPAKNNGAPPPDDYIDFTRYKPGSVTIVANKVSFPPEPKQALLRLRGAIGGIGGAGEPPLCVGPGWEKAASTISCLPSGEEISAINAPGGRGGDGGSVQILLGESASRTDLERLLTLDSSFADVRGGEPGPSKKLRSPNSLGFPHNGTISDFRDEGLWPPAPAGTPGSVSVASVPSSRLFPEFYRVVRALDGLPNYDMTEFARRVRNDRSRDALSFDDYVAARFTDRLLTALASIVDHTANRVEGGRSSGRRLVPADLCEILTRPQTMTEQSWIALIYLKEVCGVQGDLTDSFLSAKGGLLNVYDWNAYTSFRAEKLEVAVSESAEAWEKMLELLGKIEASLIQIYVSVESQRLTTAIKGVQDQLSNVQARLDAIKAKNNANPEFFKIVAAAGAAATGVGAFYVAVTVVLAEEAKKNQSAKGTTKDSPKDTTAEPPKGTTKESFEETAQMLEKLGKTGQAAVSGLQGLASVLAQKDFAKDLNATADERENLRRQVAQLVSQRELLITEMAMRKEAVLDTAASDLRNAILARARYGNRVRTRLAHFDDLYRLALLSFVLDPARLKSTLTTNLQNLQIFLRDFPRAQPSFRLRSVWPYCSREAGLLNRRCPTISPSGDPRTIHLNTHDAQLGEWKLPAYVIPPHKSPITVESLGYELDTR